MALTSRRAASMKSLDEWGLGGRGFGTRDFLAFLAGDHAAIARELDRLRAAAAEGAALGLEIHAGHGLTFDTVSAVAAIPQIAELNIGHFLIGEAIFTGLADAIAEMRRKMDEARP